MVDDPRASESVVDPALSLLEFDRPPSAKRRTGCLPRLSARG
jgi:hypothetical protein